MASETIGERIANVLRIAQGMSVTLRTMFQKPVTVQYPEEKRAVFPRFRGKHVLERYDNGLEKCIGCELCAGACPAECILVEGADNTDLERYSPGERYARRYEINMVRCIFCGLCEEACPTGAIVLKHDYELADYNVESMIYTKEMLLVPYVMPDGTVTTEPGTVAARVAAVQDRADAEMARTEDMAGATA
jgi:NADH-quinone oxidoreductase subunit I